MKSAIARQTLLMVGVVVLAGVLLSLVFRGPGERGAVWISGAVAFVVQMLAFSLARAVGKVGLTARMGVGMLVRFFALVIYGGLVALVFKQLPATPALIGLVVFFFFSSVVEPLFIK